MRKSVSIIVTNFNYLRFLPQCIESIRSQGPDELIIVDDGSTDGSQDWLTENCSAFAKIIFKPNGGQASAMNVGFSESKGDLIWFVDADDILLEGAIKCARSLEWMGVSKAHFRTVFIDAVGARGRSCPRRCIPLPTGDIRRIYSRLFYYPSVPTSGNVYGRNFLKEVFPIPADAYRICADAYLHDLAPLHGRLNACEGGFVGYRVHGGNNFASSSAKRNIDWINRKRERLRRKWSAISGGDASGRIPCFVFSGDFVSFTSTCRRMGKNVPLLLGEEKIDRFLGIFAVRRTLAVLAIPIISCTFKRVWLVLVVTAFWVFLRKKD